MEHKNSQKLASLQLHVKAAIKSEERDVKSVRTTRAPGRAVERAREFGSSGAVFAWSCRNRVKKQRRSTGTHPTSHDSSIRSTSNLQHRCPTPIGHRHRTGPSIHRLHPPVHAKEMLRRSARVDARFNG